MKLQVLTWTPSRYAKWKECPRKVKYEDLLKLCPACFKGKVRGGFNGEPVVCDTCSKPQPERGPLDRGNRLDDALTHHLMPHAGARPETQVEALTEATRHPAIAKMLKALRKAKGVSAQESIVLNNKWERVSQYTKDAWARLKLDVLQLTPKVAKIIDWKSGNIDKRTQQIRERGEYADSMLAYQIAVLHCYPQAEATATMAFLDAPPKLTVPFKDIAPLKRSGLEKARKEWERKIEGMMADEDFSPRPGYYCNWCPFSSKNKGGPCKEG